MRIDNADTNVNILERFLKIRNDIKLNVLVSYGSDSLEGLIGKLPYSWRDKLGSVTLDSGTWALNSGARNIHRNKKINLPGYKAFLELFKRRFDSYFSFDEDHKPEGAMINMSNLRNLQKAGLNPVPVIHDLDGEEIDVFIDEKYPIVALGSAQVRSPKVLEKIVKRFDGTGVKLHLFGRTDFNLIANFPIYSCDSSRWAQTAKYGNVNFWNPEKPGPDKGDTIYLGSRIGVTGKNDIAHYEHKKLFFRFLRDELDIDFLELVSSTELQQIVNLYFVVMMERAVNEIHREKGFDTAE